MYYLIQGAGILASLLTIYQFISSFRLSNNENESYKSRFRKIIDNKLFWSVLFIIITISVLFSMNKREEIVVKENAKEVELEYQKIIESLEMTQLASDAKRVSDAIVPSIYDDFAKLLADLSHIQAYYYRHRDVFPGENEFYSKELSIWSEYYDKVRRGEKIEQFSFESSIYQEVISGNDQLKQIFIEFGESEEDGED